MRKNGIDRFIKEMRSRKDAEEIILYQEICQYTDTLMDMVEKEVAAGTLSTELDVALFLERQARRMGAEGMGFESLVAGPERSFGNPRFSYLYRGSFC